jgi:hypothetical protein
MCHIYDSKPKIQSAVQSSLLAILHSSTCSKQYSFVAMHRTGYEWDLCQIIFWTRSPCFGLKFSRWWLWGLCYFSCLAYSSPRNTGVVCASETLGFLQAATAYSPENRSLLYHEFKLLKACRIWNTHLDQCSEIFFSHAALPNSSYTRRHTTKFSPWKGSTKLYIGGNPRLRINPHFIKMRTYWNET